jgi:integrase
MKYERFSTKRTDRGEAKLVVEAHRRRLYDRQQLGLKDDIKLSAAAQMYIDELTSKGSPSVKDYVIFLRYMCSYSSTSNISSLNRNLLMRVRSDMLKQNYSARYINNVMAFWVAVYNKAKNDYNLAVDNTTSFTGIKLKTEDKTRYFLNGEEERFLAEIDPRRDIKGQPAYGSRTPDMQRKLQDQYDLCVFLIDTGARYSEVATMNWQSVDVINWQSINIYRSKVGNEGTLVMTDRLREVLKRRWQFCGNNVYVFPSFINTSGKHVHGVNMSGPRGYATKGIRKAIDRAGLNAPHLVKRYGKFTPHSFRHTFASRLVQGGMSLYAVSRLLGHTTTTMTQRYAHLAPSQVADQAASILNALQGNV